MAFNKEEAQLITLIDRDQTNSIITLEEANSLRTLAHQGRILAYSITEGGEFDGYISKDELEQLSVEPQALTTEIYLMNPTWGAGQSKVTLGELAPCFDRKEMATMVDHLEAAGIHVDNLKYDEKERKVMGDVKSGQGKFHLSVDLDDGTHKAPVYDFADEQGQVAHVKEDQLGKISDIDKGMDIKALQERLDADQNPEGLSRANVGAGAVPLGRLKKLGKSFHLPMGEPRFEIPAPLSSGLQNVINSGQPSHSTTHSQSTHSPTSHHPVEGHGQDGPMASAPPSSGGSASALQSGGIPQEQGPTKQTVDQTKQQDALDKAGEEAMKQQAAQAPSRYTGGLPIPGKKKSGMGKKVAAAAALTGGTAVGIPTIAGVSSVFMDDTASEAIAFVHDMSNIIFSLFA